MDSNINPQEDGNKPSEKHLRERIESLFPPRKEIPASLSLPQVEWLKARVEELEAELAQVKGGREQNEAPAKRLPSLNLSDVPLKAQAPQPAPNRWQAFLQRVSHTSIRTRLIALILLVTIPLLLGVTITISSQASARIEADAIKSLQTTNDALFTHVETWLRLNSLNLREMTLLPGIVSMDAAQQRPILQAVTNTYPYVYLASTTDLSGMNVARNDNGGLLNYSDRTWFQKARDGQEVTYQSLVGRTTGKPALVVSMPIRNGSRQIVGVGMFAADLADLSAETLVRTVGKTGYSYIVDADNKVLAHPDLMAAQDQLQDLADYPPVAALRKGKTGLFIFTDEAGTRWRAYITTMDNGWGVITQQQESEILQAANQFRAISLSFIVVGSLIMLILATLAIQSTLEPIGSLTETVVAITAGDLNRVAEVRRQDEIGILAAAFNSMTAQLRDMIASLERRVEERTHDLELASDVGRAVTANMADPDKMLDRAAETIRARFNLHYTQIYLTDPSGRTIVLRAGTGEVGRQLLQRGHRLPIGVGSLNGRAAFEKRPMIVSDTAQSADFLPNPLLPETRSEMVVPLLVGDQVLGVLDMQSSEADTLNEFNLPAFEALAGQLSVAIQNARLFTDMQEAREELEENASRLAEQGWRDFLNAIEHSERIGFVYDQEQVVELDESYAPLVSQALSIPIHAAGAPVGVIEASFEGAEPTSAEREILEAVSARLGQRLDGLRLLAQADQYRHQAEQVSRRLTREGWDQYFQARRALPNGFRYAQNKVQPLTEAATVAETVYQRPLVVRDETVGVLGVGEPRDLPQEEATSLIDQVIANLGQHIETLRLLEQTEESRAEIQQSQERLGEALNVARLGHWEYDFEKDIFTFNDHFYAIFRTTAEKVGGYRLSSADYARLFVHPEDVPLVGEEIGRAISTTERHYEAKLEHRVIFMDDGSTGYISVSINVDRDETGKIIRLYGANQDITERRLAQETIAQRANQLETVAVVSSTASTLLDPDRLLQMVVDLTRERFRLYHVHVYLANEAWNTLLLAAGAGEVGRKMVSAGHSIPMDAEKSLVARAARGRQAVISTDVHSEEGFLPNPFLPETRSEMAVPMVVGGEVLGVFDVQSSQVDGFSEEDANIYATLAAQVAVALQNARLYAEQSATVTQLRELDRLKSSFLANMSHELRTPLNSILGFADVMLEELDGPLTENMQTDLSLIQKNGKHLLHLINDVLDMAKIEAGKMNLSLERFNVQEILEDVTSITQPLANSRSLGVFIEADSDRSVEITADRTRIRQVMLNIVNNAIKFTEAGWVSIRTEQRDDQVLIRVRDTGISIPPENLETIFQEFTQVDTSSTRKTGGTGLGLPISRRLVEMHGGRLWAESNGVEGEGSTFFVELPIEARLAEPVEKMEK